MIPDLPILEDLAEVSDAIASRGWAEANAGNVSYRLTDVESLGLEASPKFVEIEGAYPRIEGRAFLVSRTGSRFRDIAIKPRRNLLILRVERGGYRILAGEGKPTFELLSHLAIHDALKSNRPEDRAVIHTHPTCLLAFSHLPLEDHIGVLMRMSPETFHHFHEKVHFLPYELPGTEDLAAHTVAALEKTRVVVWMRHGAIATGESFSRALDPIEVLDKNAELYLKVSAVTSREMCDVGLSSDEAWETAKAMGSQELVIDSPEKD
ncbi:MAG: rhamnulose-1-phosphate aldolase [Thermoplasmata archaeon]|nr:rhamnulose-1-phosphate aldolase [Thermoplasmata archaeon]